MDLGLVGLGKMGGNMRERLRAHGHNIVGFDNNPDLSDSASLADMVKKLPAPRAVWVMVPAGAITTSVITDLSDLLEPGDVIVDGGNSRWTDDTVHAHLLSEKGIGFVDCGVSGGIWGLKNGYALMCGGDAASVSKLMPIFEALKPDSEFGFAHCGEVGSGHYAKMVHNGIEYAIMQAYAEGYELLEAADVVTNVPETMNSWRDGTVIRSWLLDLLCEALKGDPKLAGLEGYVDDSGEGRWTVEEAINRAVPIPAIAASLFARFVSRQEDSMAMKAVSAMRHEFGGHAVKRVDGELRPTDNMPH
jgi:6-phosphogluconate dehydrogenase